MADNTDDQGSQAEDNELIRSLRAEIKAAKKDAKDAVSNARAQVKREDTAKSLMPDGFQGLADIFEQEVDGDLTADSAAKWLADRGITATPTEEVGEEEPEVVEVFEEVTNLSGQVAAASAMAPTDSKLKAISEAADGIVGAGSLPDVTKALEAALNG